MITILINSWCWPNKKKLWFHKNNSYTFRKFCIGYLHCKQAKNIRQILSATRDSSLLSLSATHQVRQLHNSLMILVRRLMNSSHLMDLPLKFLLEFLKNSIRFCSLIKIIGGFKKLSDLFATRFHKKIIRQKGRKKKSKKIWWFFYFFDFFFQFNSKNFLRGRKFRWGVFKGARGGGFGVGRFKRGADLEHNHKGYPCQVGIEFKQLFGYKVFWWSRVCV